MNNNLLKIDFEFKYPLIINFLILILYLILFILDYNSRNSIACLICSLTPIILFITSFLSFIHIMYNYNSFKINFIQNLLNSMMIIFLWIYALFSIEFKYLELKIIFIFVLVLFLILFFPLVFSYVIKQIYNKFFKR